MSLLSDFFTRREIRRAEQRWREFNERRRREGCYCGKPGTVARPDPSDDFVGSVRPTWWYCVEHADVPLTTPWEINKDGTGRPMIQDADGVWH
jgi:hypothetical protein